MTGQVIRPDFERLYRERRDPWGVRTRWYERRKREVLLSNLLRRTYAVAWDPACGTGEVAARLAERCNLVLASDASAAAIRRGREDVTDQHIEWHQHALPARPRWLVRRPDLFVLSEVLYYLSAEERQRIWPLLDETSAPTGELVSVHWKQRPGDGYLDGGAVHDELQRGMSELGWQVAVRHDDLDYALLTMTRGAPREAGLE